MRRRPSEKIKPIYVSHLAAGVKGQSVMCKYIVLHHPVPLRTHPRASSRPGGPHRTTHTVLSPRTHHGPLHGPLHDPLHGKTRRPRLLSPDRPLHVGCVPLLPSAASAADPDPGPAPGPGPGAGPDCLDPRGSGSFAWGGDEDELAWGGEHAWARCGERGRGVGGRGRGCGECRWGG